MGPSKLSLWRKRRRRDPEAHLRPVLHSALFPETRRHDRFENDLHDVCRERTLIALFRQTSVIGYLLLGTVATALRAVRTRLIETRLQLTAAALDAASPIAGDVAGCRMAPTVLTGVGASGGSVAVGRIVIIVAGTTTTRQPIQNQAGWSNTGGAHKRQRASNGVSRTFSGPNYHAGSLGMRYHE